MNTSKLARPIKHSIIRKLLIRVVGHLKFGSRPKVFGIGFNKTGTTSLASALQSFGYTVAYQETAELTFKDWKIRDFNSIIDYCKYGGNAFQDAPFSFPYTFQALDIAFPKSKFILTIRDSGEQWYNSLIKFHTKRFGNGETLTKEDYLNAEYQYKGYAYEVFKAQFHTDDDDLWNKETLIRQYEMHIECVKQYFFHRPGDLLVLNVADANAMEKLCTFLNKPFVSNSFPKKNESKNY